MKLWLDDEREPELGWIWARSVDQAQTFVVNRMYLGIVWEELSLDHDLGEFGGPGREGKDFLAWMCEMGVWPKVKPKVHTANPYEAMMMRQTIERYFPKG
jgi:hypothetical protein